MRNSDYTKRLQKIRIAKGRGVRIITKANLEQVSNKLYLLNTEISMDFESIILYSL